MAPTADDTAAPAPEAEAPPTLEQLQAKAAELKASIKYAQNAVDHLEHLESAADRVDAHTKELEETLAQIEKLKAEVAEATKVA